MLTQVRYRCCAGARRLLSSISAAPAETNFSIKGMAIEGRPAYLDFQATTPLDPRALDAMVMYSVMSPLLHVLKWVLGSSDALPRREVREPALQNSHVWVGDRDRNYRG